MPRRVILGWLMIGYALIVTIVIPVKYPEVNAVQLFELYWFSYLSLAALVIAGGCLVLAGRRR